MPLRRTEFDNQRALVLGETAVPPVLHVIVVQAPWLLATLGQKPCGNRRQVRVLGPHPLVQMLDEHLLCMAERGIRQIPSILTRSRDREPVCGRGGHRVWRMSVRSAKRRAKKSTIDFSAPQVSVLCGI